MRKTMMLAASLLFMATAARAMSLTSSCAPDQISILCPQTIVAGSTTAWTGQNSFTQGITLPDGTVLTSTAPFGGGSPPNIIDFGLVDAVTLRALACSLHPAIQCRAQNSTDFDLYTSTGSSAGNWRNSRTGVGP